MAKMPKGNKPDKIAAALEALLETRPDADPSLLSQVARHFELIEKLRAQGHSFARIAEALRQVDVDISENTLMQYVGRLRRQGSQTRATKPTFDAVIRPTRRKAISVPAAIKPADLPSARSGARKGEDMEAWLTAEPDETQI
jgi:hypothetical protein